MNQSSDFDGETRWQIRSDRVGDVVVDSCASNFNQAILFEGRSHFEFVSKDSYRKKILFLAHTVVNQKHVDVRKKTAFDFVSTSFEFVKGWPKADP